MDDGRHPRLRHKSIFTRVSGLCDLEIGQRTKAIEHNDGDDCHTCQGQMTDVACDRKGIKSCQAEGEDKTDGQGR